MLHDLNQGIKRQLDKMEDHLDLLESQGEDVSLDRARIQGTRRTLELTGREDTRESLPGMDSVKGQQHGQ